MKAGPIAAAFLGAVKASHFAKEQYESGEVHQIILDMKNVRIPENYLVHRPISSWPLSDTLLGPVGCC